MRLCVVLCNVCSYSLASITVRYAVYSTSESYTHVAKQAQPSHDTNMSHHPIMMWHDETVQTLTPSGPTKTNATIVDSLAKNTHVLTCYISNVHLRLRRSKSLSERFTRRAGHHPRRNRHPSCSSREARAGATLDH